MPVKVLFLDYDGVIVDSMGPKAEAIADAFAPYSDDRAAIADGFHRHAGSGLEAQFDRIYKDLTGNDARHVHPRAHRRCLSRSRRRHQRRRRPLPRRPRLRRGAGGEAARRRGDRRAGGRSRAAACPLRSCRLVHRLRSRGDAARRPSISTWTRFPRRAWPERGRCPLRRRFADRHATGGAGGHSPSSASARRSSLPKARRSPWSLACPISPPCSTGEPAPRGPAQCQSLSRHGRTRSGHPLRHSEPAQREWMPGTSPGMTAMRNVVYTGTSWPERGAERNVQIAAAVGLLDMGEVERQIAALGAFRRRWGLPRGAARIERQPVARRA